MKNFNMLVIANPAAGGLSARRLGSILGLLEGKGVSMNILWTKGPGSALTLAREAKAADMVMVAGGDGTLNEVANGLYREGIDCPLACMPSGTANVFAHETSLPRDIEALADLVLQSTPASYFPGQGRFEGSRGEAVERIFLLMAGVGWDAGVVKEVNPGMKRIASKAAYVYTGLKHLLRGGNPKIRLLADDKPMEGEGLIIANSPYYGGSFSLVPTARVDGSRLAMAVIKKISFSTTITLLASARSWRADRSGNVAYGEADRIEIVSSGIPLQIDGDFLGFTPALFSKAARPLRVIRRQFSAPGDDPNGKDKG